MSLPAMRSYAAATALRLFPLRDSSVLAEPWRRLLAAAIDTSLIFLVYVAGMGLVLIYCGESDLVDALVRIISTAVCWTYVLVGWSLGATIGMRFTGILLVTEDLGRMNVRTALLRIGGFILASLPVKFGLLPILYDDRRQGWHDRLAHTLVIKTSAAAGSVVPDRRPPRILPPPPLPDFTVAAGGAWIALPIYAAVVIAETWPTVMHLGSRIMGEISDPYIFIWNYWYFLYSLKSHISPINTNLIFYPHVVSLSLHTMQWFNCILAAPLQHWLGLVAIYNILNLVSMTASTFALYWMTASIAGRRAPALVAALAFGVSPYFEAHGLGHANLVAAEFIPLFALCAYGALVTYRVRYAVWAGIWLALSGLCDLQYLAFDVLFAAALYVAVWLLFERPPLSQMLRRAKLLLGAFAIAGVLLAPIAIPAVSAMGGRSQDKTGAAGMFRVDLADWVRPGAGSRIYGQQLTPSSRVEQSVTPGIVLLVLAVTGSIFFWPKARLWCWLGLVFVVLACGPYLTINGVNCSFWQFLVTGFPGTGFGLPWQTDGATFCAGIVVTDPTMLTSDAIRITMPFSWLPSVLPVMRSFRVPARFAVLVLMCVSVLAALGLQAIRDILSRRSTIAAALATIASGLLILAEYYCAPYPTFVPPTLPYFSTLGREPGHGAVIEQPLMGNEESAYGQTFHHRPLFKSFISRMPKGDLDLVESNAFLRRSENVGQAGGIEESRAGLEQLRQLGAEYVVFSMSGSDPVAVGNCKEFEKISNAPLVYSDGSVRVYRLRVLATPGSKR